jgi:diguanylate cyclase (GGDEF)-like protein
VILILSLLFLSASASAEAKNRDVLIVGVPDNRCPVFYRDADSGEVTGIGVDLMRFAAEKAGYTVSFRFVEEETLPEALDSRAYDLVMPFGSAVASASGRQTVVSDNLIQTPFTLVTKNRGDLPEWNALRIGMLRSLKGGAETARELYPGIGIILYDSMDKAVQALRKGEVDALLHNSFVWSYVLQKPAYSKLSVQPSAMLSMDFRAGAPDTPESREIISRLNGGIAEITDTLRNAVVLDYTTRRLYHNSFSDYLYEYALIILLCACLIASVVLIVIEKQRTMKLEQEEKLRRLVDQDPLTGLLSLEGLRKQAEKMLRDHPDQPYVLVYANIRNFKYINDNLGKACGDELLCFWADRSRETLPEEDIICRLGADHFAVLSRAKGEDKLAWHEHHVIDAVRSYFIDHGKEVRVQICGGIYVLTPHDYRDINIYRMLDYARMAEKKSVKPGKKATSFTTPSNGKKENGSRRSSITCPLRFVTAISMSGTSPR